MHSKTNPPHCKREQTSHVGVMFSEKKYPDSENTSQQTSNQNCPFIAHKMLNITATHYGLFSEDQMSAWLTERCTKYVQHTALHVHSMKFDTTDCSPYQVQIQYFWKLWYCTVCGYLVTRGFQLTTHTMG